MAQKITVELVDDLDGSTSDDISTVSFGLDGVTYDIDLTEANAEELRDQLGPFVTAARRVGGRRARGTRPASDVPRPAVDHERNQSIRAWANDNGYELSSRGRIPVTVIEQYDAAQAAPPAPQPKRRRKKAASTAA
ncbi:histone-like nucleoid-structuring protein Lsr2 [Prauserella cavernicola]|uniref:Lsr2 family protein n=1 Tax=Prauserella cavernicola TaxID=2800127 RepID=A0A934QLY8_9PSEU|nr:Lsr2 family protein [Prauserella cavernicola]MBK1783892.1 Lsr2 family protein [Prauserella cavernicola]